MFRQWGTPPVSYTHLDVYKRQQPYCYTISGESIIRQLGYGIAKIKEYFPHAVFTTYSVEEPCFTSCLPQILKGFGYRYAVLRNPNTCWGGYTTGFNKDLVNWIGPDGTTLVAVPRYGCEGLEKNSTWQTESWDNSPEFIRSCFESGVKFPVGMCFQDAGWRHGPWLENAVRRFHRPTTYVTWSNYIEMVSDYVTPEDWAFSLEDVKPGLVWGAQVLQNIAREVRQSENLIVMAEKMAALDYLYNKGTWPCEDFAEAWRTLMLAQHHDCWIVPYNGKPGDTFPRESIGCYAPVFPARCDDMWLWGSIAVKVIARVINSVEPSSHALYVYEQCEQQDGSICIRRATEVPPYG